MLNLKKTYHINNFLSLEYNDSLNKYIIISNNNKFQDVLRKEKDFLKLVYGDEIISKDTVLEDDKKALILNFKNNKKLKKLSDVSSLDIKKHINIFINICLKIQKIHNENILHGNLNLESLFIDEEYNPYIFNYQTSINFLENDISLSSVYFKDLHIKEKSPEQIGRINNQVDLRSDLYALGLIFYQILQKEHPFESENQLEVLHFTLTKNIRTIDDIPSSLSNIIKKLLEKEVSLRYQSIEGLIFDLKQIQNNLELELKIAQRDISSKLQLPYKVYGRENESSYLIKKYQNILAGEKEVLFISGYSGIGKSSLINKLKIETFNSSAMFISSKYDQYNNSLPYYGISIAFRSLVKQLLTKSNKNLEDLKNKLLKSLQGNGKILIDIIPELENIIGKQKEVEPLPSSESENRFTQVFINFLKSVNSKEMPIVLVIDDLQWMDLSTLKLLEQFINNEDLKYIFILAAFRDNELKENLALKNIIDKNKNIEIFHLKPLKKDSLEQFIKDTLFLEKEEVSDLVNEVYVKTNANPFFFRQFIKRLYDDKLISFDKKKLKWQYDISKIKAENITDNVAKFMLKNISSLDMNILYPLQIASCLGATFELRVLADILDKPVENIILQIKTAFNKGFLIPLDVNIYNLNDLLNNKNIKVKFLHDQVQQAVYLTIDSKKIQEYHFKIAKVLYNNTNIDKNLFEIISHFNFSRSLIIEEDEKRKLISLNKKACSFARKSTACYSALKYLQISKEVLEDIYTKKDYSEYVNILIEYVELLYLTSNFEIAKLEVENLFNLINNTNDEIKLRRILTVQYTRIGMLKEAIEEGLISLHLLGHDIKKDLTFEDIQKEIGFIQNELIETPFKKLVNKKQVQDKKIIQIMDILMEMQPCSYNSGSLIFPLTILRLFALTIKHGNSPLSYYTYMMYALMNTKVLKDYDTAFEAAKYAKQIEDNSNKSILSGRFNMMLSNFIMPWNNQLKESQKLRVQSYSLCLEYGDYYWGIHSYIFGFYANMLSYSNLDDLLIDTKNIENVSKNINQISQVHICQMQMNLINILKGDLKNKKDLNHINGFEEEALLEYDKQNYMCGKYNFIIARLVQGYFFENYEEALSVSLNDDLDENWIDEGIFHEAFYKVFNVLCILALDLNKELKESLRDKYYKYIDETLELIKIWQKNSPDVFSCIKVLIDAEKASLSNDLNNAMIFYEEAISLANTSEILLFKAICNERYSYFWKRRDNSKISDLYLGDAIEYYKAYKAKAKVELLEQKLSTSKQKNKNRSIDLDIIVKSSNIISKEVKLEKLTKNILDLVFKLSGAQNAYMFLCQDDEIDLAAKINVDEFNYFLNESAPLIELPLSVLLYVKRTKEVLLVNDLLNYDLAFDDKYLLKYKIKSLLCIPLILNDEVKAIIYLDNYSLKNVFTLENVEVLSLLSSQMVISIENSLFYEKLENTVKHRTKDLKDTLSLFDMGQILFFKWENADNWPVSYLSNNVVTILGYEKVDFIEGKLKYSDLIHPDDFNTVLAEVTTASEKKLDTFSHKPYRLKHKDGSYLWLYDSTKIIYNDKKEIIYYLGYIVDISEEKRREEYLLQQTKMIALGEMIGNIAHQWRQPLSIISTSITSLKLKEELKLLQNDDIGNTSDIIMNTVVELSETIDNFSDFLSVEIPMLEEHNLFEIFEKSITMVNHFLINYDICVEKNIPLDINVKCTENQLIQVFINILTNAKDALLFTGDEDKLLKISAFKELNSVSIIIEDNAGGIKKEMLDKIFEPYVTTKHQSQGTGLGLYLTHQIITNELSGEITAKNGELIHKNKKYKSAIFTIELND